MPLELPLGGEGGGPLRSAVLPRPEGAASGGVTEAPEEQSWEPSAGGQWHGAVQPPDGVRQLEKLPPPPRQRQRPRAPREPVPRHRRQSRPPVMLCFPCFTALRGFCGWFSVCRCYFPGKTHNPTLYWSPSHPGQSEGDGLTRPGSFTIGRGTSHRNSEHGIFTLACNFDARNISPRSTEYPECGFTEI